MNKIKKSALVNVHFMALAAVWLVFVVLVFLVCLCGALSSDAYTYTYTYTSTWQLQPPCPRRIAIAIAIARQGQQRKRQQQRQRQPLIPFSRTSSTATSTSTSRMPCLCLTSEPESSSTPFTPYKPSALQIADENENKNENEATPLIDAKRPILLQNNNNNTNNPNDNDDKPPKAKSKAKAKSKYGSTGEAVLDLAIPALAALLIDPLMTLADTGFVGRYAETPAALAGMGSAAALLTFSFYLFGFLTKVTTPLVSSQRAAGNEPAAVAVGGQALSLALGLGLVLSFGLVAGQDYLLSIMGAANAGPETVSYAKDFLVVRALAAPAVLCIAACTGILRGYLDTKTPILILVAANVLNFFLDIVLIVAAHLGPLGAAIATTTAEWISALLFLGVLAGRLPSAAGELGSNHQQIQKEKETQHSSSMLNKTDTTTTTTTTMAIVPTLSIPPWKEIEPLLIASSSVFLRSLVLQLALSSAAALAARNGQVVAASSLGAHQIGIQLWLLCSFISDALAAASQGLVADALGRNSKTDARDIAKTVFTYSVALGVTLGSILYIGTASNFLLDFFTQDPLTQAELARILPLIIFSQPLNSYVFAADGVMEGASEFTFQAQSMVLCATTAWGVFLMLQGMGYSDGDTLVQVWTCLIVLQLMRGITASWKIIQKEGPIGILE